MHPSDLLVLLILIAGAVAAVYTKKLTSVAGITGLLTAVFIYAGVGLPGLLLLALFFLLGTTATSWGKEKKRLLKGSAAHEPTRSAGQVLANGGIAATAGIGSLLFPGQAPLFLLLIAAGLSSATADTLSSELGMIYGRRCYHILTLRPDQRGLDGVISIEGTLIGIAGSILIATAFNLSTRWSLHSFGIVVLAGTIGNLADSALGALFERKGILRNNAVNFLNTLIAALIALVLS